MMRAQSADILEQSYLLPNEQRFSDYSGDDSIYQGISYRHACEKIERIDEIISENKVLEHRYCKFCLSDVERRMTLVEAELQFENNLYKRALEREKVNKQTKTMNKNDSLREEVTKAEMAFLQLKKENTDIEYQCTVAEEELHKTARVYNETLRDVCQLDLECEAIDREMLRVLDQLDSASKEINHLRNLKQTRSTADFKYQAERINCRQRSEASEGIVRNAVEPLFNIVETPQSAGSKTVELKVITINNCRLSYMANSSLNLNFNEINLAFVNLSLLVVSLRNLHGSDLLSATADSSSHPTGHYGTFSAVNCSVFHNKSFALHFLKQHQQQLQSGGELDGVVSRVAELVVRNQLHTKVQTVHAHHEQQSSGTHSTKATSDSHSSAVPVCIMRVRPLKDRALLLLSTDATTNVHGAVSDKQQQQGAQIAATISTEWLYLEGGVFDGHDRKERARRRRNATRETQLDFSSSTMNNISALSNSFISGLIAQSIFPAGNTFVNANATPVTQAGGIISGESKKSDSSHPDEEEEDCDSAYLRAVLGMVAVITVTCLDVLLLTHNLTSSALQRNSNLTNYNILTSLINTHFVGSSRAVAYALLVGVPVGYEYAALTAREVAAVSNSVDNDGRDDSDGNDSVEEQEEDDMVFVLSTSQKSSLPRDSQKDSRFDNRGVSQRSGESCGVGSGGRVQSLFSRKSRSTEIHNLLVDTVLTLKQVCSL